MCICMLYTGAYTTAYVHEGSVCPLYTGTYTTAYVHEGSVCPLYTGTYTTACVHECSVCPLYTGTYTTAYVHEGSVCPLDTGTYTTVVDSKTDQPVQIASFIVSKVFSLKKLRGTENEIIITETQIQRVCNEISGVVANNLCPANGT